MRLPDPLPPHLATLRQRHVDVAGVRIAYAEAGPGAGPGAGPPVLFLHGAVFAGNVFWWESVADAAARGMRAIAPDFPGWGDSARPAGDYGMAYYHDFISAFLNALGLERVSIVGHSMGALLGSSYAVLHPERVARLAIVAAPAAWTAFDMPLVFRAFTVPAFGEAIAAALPVLGTESPIGIRRFYEGLMHRPGAIEAPRMRAMLQGCVDATRDPLHRLAFLRTLRANLGTIRGTDRAPYVATLREQALPVLIVAGRDDRLFPLPLVAAGAAGHPGIRLEVLDACGHFPMWEQAEAVSSLLGGFLLI